MPAPVTKPGSYVLVFGLSADPVHQGHIALALSAVHGLRHRGYAVRTVLLIPVFRRSPVGGDKDWLPQTFSHRYRMCELAAEAMREVMPDVDFYASRIEADLVQHIDKPNFTAETLRALEQEIQPGQRLIFLISSEIVSGEKPQFSHWYQPESILASAVLAVCPRPGFCANQTYLASLVDAGAEVVYMPDVCTPDIAANALRARLCAGESPETLVKAGLLSPRIAAYITAEDVYTACTW